MRGLRWSGAMALVLLTGAVALSSASAMSSARPSSRTGGPSGGGTGSSRAHTRRPGCGAQCRQLGGAGGEGGGCVEGPDPGSSTEALVSESRQLKLRVVTELPTLRDLMLVTIESTGDPARPVTPPRGWSQVPQAAATDGTERIQVFAKIADATDGRTIPMHGGTGGSGPTYTFTSASPQWMAGVLVNFMGVSPTQPIVAAAGQVNAGASSTVTAPSITPSQPESLLVYIGASPAEQTWHPGPALQLTPIAVPPTGIPATHAPLVVATQRWHPVAPTGTRSAVSSGRGPSIGVLVALNYPPPVSCPSLKLLTHRFIAHRDGVTYARIRCTWTVTCTGAFEGLQGDNEAFKLAASDFSVPAGTTRTVPIALTRLGLASLERHPRQKLDPFVWVFTRLRQPVLAAASLGRIALAG